MPATVEGETAVAAGAGLLTTAEVDERLARVYAARHGGDLTPWGFGCTSR